MKNSIDVKLNVRMEDVANLLCSAFEGGSNYWYMIEEQKVPERFEFLTDAEKVFPHIDYPLNPGGSLTITTLEGDEFNGKKKWTLDLAAVQRGLAKMAKAAPRHFADVLRDNADATTGDVFLQFCLFGEVVYG